MENKLLNRGLYRISRDKKYNIQFELSDKGKEERGLPQDKEYVIRKLKKSQSLIIKKKIISDRFIYIAGINLVEDEQDEINVGKMTLEGKKLGGKPWGPEKREKHIFICIYDVKKDILNYDDKNFGINEEEMYDIIPSLDCKELVFRYSSCTTIMKRVITRNNFERRKGNGSKKVWRDYVDYYKRDDKWTEGREIISFGENKSLGEPKERYAEIKGNPGSMDIIFFRHTGKEKYEKSRENVKTFSYPCENENYDFIYDRNSIYISSSQSKSYLIPFKEIKESIFKRIDVNKVFSKRIDSSDDLKFHNDSFEEDLLSANSKFMRFLKFAYLQAKKWGCNEWDRVTNSISKDGLFFLDFRNWDDVNFKQRVLVYDLVSKDICHILTPDGEWCFRYGISNVNYDYLFKGRVIDGVEGINPRRVKGLTSNIKGKFISLMLEGICEKEIFLIEGENQG